MKVRYLTPLLCIGMLTLSGCNDPKKPSESNFKEAAQQYLNTVYPVCYIKANFPYKTDGISFNNMPEVLHAMAEKGLLTEKELSRKHIDASWGIKAHDLVVNSYDLTEEGKKYYKADAAKNIRGENIGGFCFGKATVTEVSNFTEPSDAMGQKISRVSFSYKVSEIPEWAKTPEILTAVRQIKKDVDSAKDGMKVTNVFVLTNNGWIHEKLFGK
ncbi:TPA: hypothetical protein MB351_004303 [Klebsiella pneumoniae]|uniref:hypothetical protein n=1 Tax=Klebsiella pneumoniae TaxID=573 RepID=UPI00203F9BD1|nr:hypothetical protein [Klebsiella pneumoniae]USC03907.1 hypothetical protein KU665_26300 [Klebsiella pneumoniae]HBT4848241.1 hypothetical protein [Klebsiella pneumoniae]HBT4861813.1 hypothetical protein [Klebsiella pneumoniae]HBT4877323.1 hypothetical protein [Klebsiella pneumoniae]